ncbi:MAG: IclR family KDG regulon transcriptional repressor [Neolewinella sp.]|jgi:IclR family KDG regulon transcriptional repressor
MKIKTDQTEKTKPKGLSSLTNAIHLMKIFNEQEYELGISAMAKRLGLAKSTVYRMASTLAQEGLLEKNPANDKYRLGIALFGFGTLVRRRMDVSNEARSILMDLRSKVNETVLLSIPEQYDIMCVNHFESTQAVHIRTDIGVRKPMASTAEGIVYLAFREEAAIDDVLSLGLAQRTPATVTDPDKIRKKIREAAKRGFAVDHQESDVGMCCISAPLFNAEGTVVACITIAGPAQRMSKTVVTGLVPDIMTAAAAISRRLGYVN